MKKILVSMFVIASLTKGLARAETLTWDPPTTHENGTPLDPSELKEYHLYDQRKIIKIIPVPTIIAPIYPGTTAHVWEVTAVDKLGHQSGYSNAVSWYPTPIATIQWPPEGPSNLTIK